VFVFTPLQGGGEGANDFPMVSTTSPTSIPGASPPPSPVTSNLALSDDFSPYYNALFPLPDSPLFLRLNFFYVVKGSTLSPPALSLSLSPTPIVHYT